MAIIQISKIQQRSGNLVDLPQLDEAQFGWANDEKRLFIGTTTPNPVENVEVLTAYSNISFSQIDGSYGNLNIDIANSNVAANSVGEVLAFDGTNWVNAGGNTGGEINLGNVSNVTISGGAIGYILETDGLGNLSWTPKGTLYSNIIGLSNANPIVMTVANSVPYTNKQPITISGANGVSNSIVNGQTFYVKLASNYPTTGNVTLYSDSTLTTPVDGTGLTYTNSPNAIATAIISTGSGIGTPGGSTSTIQFNDSGTFGGNAGFVFNNTTGAVTISANLSSGNANLGNLAQANFFTGTLTTNAQPNITSVGTLTSLTVSGNANVGNLGSAGTLTATRLISNIATGTAPFTVTSTTQVANLNVATAGSISNGNSNVSIPSSNGNVNLNAVGNTVLVITGTGANVNGTANVSGNLTAGNVGATVGAFTGNVSALNANLGNLTTSNYYAGTLTTAAQPNITSVGTLTSLGVSGTITGANIVANTGSVQTTVLTTGANTTAGTITGNWGLSTGSKLTATYADLAEYYEADQQYEPGTVVAFGGDKEVTIAEDGTTKVAGIVSTNPAYVMNGACAGEHIVALALQGRVPCKVRGNIKKGDMLISAGYGFARPAPFPVLGTVIGKSLENFEGIEGVIEVAVGRL